MAAGRTPSELSILIFQNVDRRCSRAVLELLQSRRPDGRQKLSQAKATSTLEFDPVLHEMRCGPESRLLAWGKLG